MINRSVLFSLALCVGACAASVPGSGFSQGGAVASPAAPTTATQVAAPAGSEDAGMREAINRAMARVYPALVRVNIVTTEPSDGRLEKMQASGSGAIITPEGHVVTNHHVAGKATRIVCRMPDGEEIDADLVGTDALADIAVLKLKLDTRKNPQSPVPVAKFGDSSRVKVGDVVLAMGSPGGMTQSVTKGIVSNTSMMFPSSMGSMFQLDGEQTGSLVRWLGHDAQIYGGNSGGPLVNLEGDIIGINEVGVAGLGGAIPADLAQSIVKQLIEQKKVLRSWTGLECQPRLKGASEEKGVLVSGIVEKSPAVDCGVQAGDILTEFDGVKVDARLAEDLPLFNRLVLSTPIGKEVSLTVQRKGEEKKFSLKTVAREMAVGDDKELKAWDITVRDLTIMSALELKRSDKQGVFISSLRRGGAASEAKPALKEEDIIRDVNGQPVANIEELKKVTDEITHNNTVRVPVLVGFERKSEKLLTVVQVGKEAQTDEPASARKAWLPVLTQVLTKELARAVKLEGQSGVRVTRILPGHAAEKAGMKVGDILLKLDGDAIPASQPEDTEVLREKIRQYKIGSEVTFDAVRDGQPLQFKVTLEAPPKPTQELQRYKDDYFELTVREVSFDDRENQQLKQDDPAGVLIETLEPAGWASLAQVEPGDILVSIDGKPTPDVATVRTLLEDARKRQAKRVSFFVRRGIHSMFLQLEPSWDGGKK
ncbi:MAG TPA: PDZ domain-containing protein [Candidatus Sumerlaeota bacterium]|nr:PDZ domain-containing protein [Candidatus Sumerlaeota bacterium]